MGYLLMVKQFQEYQYKEQERAVTTAGVDASAPCRQYSYAAVVVKEHQINQDEEKQFAVVPSASRTPHTKSPLCTMLCIHNIQEGAKGFHWFRFF